MPVLSPKRQITLPKALCERLHVGPGDTLDILEHNGLITVLKKTKDRSAGILKHVKADRRYSDDDSLRDALSDKGSKPRGRRRAA